MYWNTTTRTKILPHDRKKPNRRKKNNTQQSIDSHTWKKTTEEREEKLHSKRAISYI
jgi:hypothetical protein